MLLGLAVLLPPHVSNKVDSDQRRDNPTAAKMIPPDQISLAIESTLFDCVLRQADAVPCYKELATSKFEKKPANGSQPAPQWVATCCASL